MPDRNRSVDLARTPVAIPPDAITQFAAQDDISDFAPTMKGGAEAAGALAVASADQNLALNGGFEEGVGTWVPFNGATTLSIATTHVSEGAQALRCQPDGTDLSCGARSVLFALPIEAQAIGLAFDVYFQRVSSTDPRKFAEIRFYDDTGAQVGDQALTEFSPIADSVFETISIDIPVPDGATQVQVWKVGVESFSGINMPVTEAVVIDNFVIQVVPIFVGLARGAGWFDGGIFGLMLDSSNLTDTTWLGLPLGSYKEWGVGIGLGEGVRFYKEPSWAGLNLGIEVSISGRIVNGSAATRTVDVKVEISLDDGSTWIAGDSVRINLAAAGGANSIPVTRNLLIKRLASAVTTSIVGRASFTQINGVGSDCTANDGYMVVRVAPVRGS